MGGGEGIASALFRELQSVALTSLTARRILPMGRIDHLVIYHLLAMVLCS